jgi:pimeloyl-ACP methyl ester carboxylesterase
MTSATTTQTIAFVHGAFITRRCWDGWVADYAERGYTCVPIAYPGRTAPVAALRARRDDGTLGALTIEAVLDHIASVLQGLPEKPLLIGHSLGGLLTQLMLQRGLTAGCVAIDSVPPRGVTSLAWSFLRSLWPVVNPFVASSRPYMMSFEHFQYAFANDLPLVEQRAAYEAQIVPESRRLARGALGPAARIDFTRPHAPLLMIAGELDHLMPASLNRRNHGRYGRSSSVADFMEFPARAHHSILAGPGWQYVADEVLAWAIAKGCLAAAPGGRTHEPASGGRTTRTGARV